MEDDVLQNVTSYSIILKDALQILSEDKKEDCILEHITNAVSFQERIPEFKSGMEWFNVSKELTLTEDLKGKIVVLDFFTYCCINCMHILPTLKKLEEEFSIEKGVVIVGVHSAKFKNEKDSANILAAIQKHNISHPVVNDVEGIFWNTLGISCWPTLLILGPNGELLFLLVGENDVSLLPLLINSTVQHFKSQLSKHVLPIALASYLLPHDGKRLLFPGKVVYHCYRNYSSSGDRTNTRHPSLNNNNDYSVESSGSPTSRIEELLAISDTGNHRIIIITVGGKIECVIGGTEPGFIDGSFNEARFHSPQGIVFQDSHIVYVADTENHAIREINRKTKQVRTIAGTGMQGNDLIGNNNGIEQRLSSPWDLCLISSSVLHRQTTECNKSELDVLLIAMAGLHQIWALFLKPVAWWKENYFLTGTCSAVIGSGKEQNRNNSYPHAAALAQPSGISPAPEIQALFFADSESSSIRKVSLIDGSVSAVVGGDRDPTNLFAFGDVDGLNYDVKLQHPLGVAWSSENKMLYVVDSYNHKVKCINPVTKSCTTLIGNGHGGDKCGTNDVQLNEPGGICVSKGGDKIYIADTNNHCIKVFDVYSNTTEKIPILFFNNPSEDFKEKVDLSSIVQSDVDINNNGGQINLNLQIRLHKDLRLTENAPHSWKLYLPEGGLWSASSCQGEYSSPVNLILHVPSQQKGATSEIFLPFHFYVCKDDSCSVKNIVIRLLVNHLENAAAIVNHNFSYVIPA